MYAMLLVAQMNKIFRRGLGKLAKHPNFLSEYIYLIDNKAGKVFQNYLQNLLNMYIIIMLHASICFKHTVVNIKRIDIVLHKFSTQLACITCAS